MVGITLKQFQRTYPGNFKWNFVLGLSSANDIKTKNYTNFYLSNNYTFSDIFNIDSAKLKANNIYTTIQYGNDYLKFSIADSFPYSEADRYPDYINYGTCSFTNISGMDTTFTITILDDNICNIYHSYQYKKYYLVSDVSNKLAFVKDKLLSFNNSNVNPQDFKYLLSEDQKSLQLFKASLSGEFFITKSGNKLDMFLIKSDNNVTYVSSPPFKIQRSIYTYPNVSLNTSFITYTNDNNLDYTKSIFNLKNNFLIHKKYITDESFVDIIPLKNQLLQEDVFASSNNMFLNTPNALYVDHLRDYSSISQDIKEETTDDLDINYVFYNKTYKIKSGLNYFTSPSSMYPYSQLNINDSKFIDCGAFSYSTPQYADKVYQLSNDPQNYNNGQYLLCTWLSGAPNSRDKVWIDRYYYPDRIEKASALSGNPVFQSTYDDYIESLILSNSSIRSSVDQKKFFDKLSDLSFKPNCRYMYDRIQSSKLESLSSTITVCNNYTADYPSNYFTDINNSNKFTLGFYFLGDDSEWIVKSDSNAIESGVYISKNSTSIYIKYNLFDPSDGSYRLFDITVPFKQLKQNFISIAIDAITGNGYFFLNTEIIKTISIPIYQFVKKQLLYGDFFVIKNDIKTNLLVYSGQDISDPFISDTFIDSNLSFTLPILNGKMKIDDIYITLPCGMRNSVDSIEYLQSVCGSSAFKSNNINLRLKNMNISNQNVLNGIKESINSSLTNILPVNTKINTIEFDNFK